MNLHNKKCVPCEGGIKPFTLAKAQKYLTEVPGWDFVDDGKKICRGFKFKDFKVAMTFVNKVAELAESEGHHPDIHVLYNRVILKLCTHAIDGLSENDFILAVKINTIK